MKYNIGDKVRIKDDLINVDMQKYINKKACIKDVYGTLGYTLDISGRWVWSDEMLEDITEKPDINKNMASEMAKTMTREEFLKQSKGKCPSQYGLVGNISDATCNNFNDCDSCREYAIKDIFFIGDKVTKQNGTNFSNEKRVATVTKIEKSNCGDYNLIWLNDDLGWTEEEKITLYKGESQINSYRWIFNIKQFQDEYIAILCPTATEFDILFKTLIINGIDLDKSHYQYSYSDEDIYICYDLENNTLEYCDEGWYQDHDYTIYHFKDVDFSQVYDKESIDKVALNNKVEEFNITKIKSITLNELLSKRQFKTGDIVSNNEKHVGILLDGKVIYINTTCQESFNEKSYCNFIPVENIRGIPYFINDLSKYMNTKDYSILEDYFISIQGELKQVTICKVTHTSDSDKLKEFVLDSNKTVTEGEIVECQNNLTTCNWQYARVREVEIKYMTEDEFVGYKVCRKLS